MHDVNVRGFGNRAEIGGRDLCAQQRRRAPGCFISGRNDVSDSRS